jgi:hypothetical protein
MTARRIAHLDGIERAAVESCTVRTPTTSRPIRLAAALLAACLLAGPGCGALDKPAPRSNPRPTQCQSLSQLAPAFSETIRSGRAEKLRVVLERNKLMEPQTDGSSPPILTLLRVVLGTLNAMAKDPPERGAPRGELCNSVSPPAPRDANRMCEVRRLIQVFVHEGKGLETLNLLDPLLAGALRYIVGSPPSATVSHYEVAGVLSDLCSKPAICRPEDTFDMLAGILSYVAPTTAEPKRPKNLLATLNAFLQHPSVKSLLASMTAKLTLDELILFANLLMDNLFAMPTDPAKFANVYHRDMEVKINDLLTSTLKISRTDPKYKDLRLALDKILGPHEKEDESQPHGNVRPMMFDMLDPGRPQPILVPMQRSLDCFRKVDTKSVLMQMVHALGYKEGVVGLNDIVRALEGVADTDDRGTIVHFAIMLVGIIRQDGDGLLASRKLCATLLSTKKPADGSKSNAELITPLVTEVFEQRAVQEIVCVADTLLFGCAGGPRPACPNLSTQGP